MNVLCCQSHLMECCRIFQLSSTHWHCFTCACLELGYEEVSQKVLDKQFQKLMKRVWYIILLEAGEEASV